MRKIAFLDRDGVLNKEVNYLYKIDDYSLIENCLKALMNLKNLGFEFVIITNQAGIAKGIFTEEQYFKLTDFYLKEFQKYEIEFLEVLYCPNHPDAKIEKYKKDCLFRKPNPGMINKIIEMYDVDIDNSILVGDKIIDIQCGINAGIKKNFFVESGHKISESDRKHFKIYKNLYSVSLSIMD